MGPEPGSAAGSSFAAASDVVDRAFPGHGDDEAAGGDATAASDCREDSTTTPAAGIGTGMDIGIGTATGTGIGIGD